MSEDLVHIGDAAGSTMPAGDVAALQPQLAQSERERQRLSEALSASETRERHLAGELRHRVRNMLAVIRSIYRRSRENSGSPDEFAEHFEGRLNAVARCQTVESSRDGSSIDLEDMIRDELLDVRCLDQPGVSLSGPSVGLSAKAAELMGLAIHELTTNAIKFGALYHHSALTIEWSLPETSTGRTLHLLWREEGVRLLAPAPRPTGFGRQFIEEGLPYQLGATTTFTLRPGGITCSIILPLPQQDLPPHESAVRAEQPFARVFRSETDESLA